MKTIRQIGRDAFLRALCAYVFVATRVRASAPRVLGAFALASAMLVAGFSAAQAQTPTTTTLVSSPNPSVAGQPVAFTATVTGAGGTPTGTLTFLDGGSPIGTAPLDGTGNASFSTSILAVGNHTITASYPGDGTFGSSTGSLTGNPQVVNKNGTTTQILSSANPSASTEPVTFTAILSPVTPTGGGLEPSGSVTFLDNGSPIGTGTLGSNGQATFTTTALALGNHTITTTYNGDANFTGSTGSLTGNPQVVNKATTTMTLVSSLNPSTTGQSVTFTATVSPSVLVAATPTGTVTFFDGGSQIGTGMLSPSGVNGQAIFTTSVLTVGNHTITASYPSDGNFANTTGSLNSNPQVVNAPVAVNTSTTVAASPTSSVFGQSVTLTATITPASGTTAPGGTVTFSDAFGTIGSAPASQVGATNVSTASIITTALPVGTLAITASYGGNGTFNPSTGSTPFTVAKANSQTALISSANPSSVGQPVTFTATITAVSPGAGTPGGSVTFLDNGNPIGTGTLSGGVTTFTTSTLTAGTHAITTSYAGDNNFNGSTVTLIPAQVVNKVTPATTGVTSSPNPSTFGQAVTITATIIGSGGLMPTGSVTFTDTFNAHTTTLGTASLNGSGQASLPPISNLAVGTHTIQANYGGDANFNSSTASTGQAVNQATSTIAIMSSQNPSAFGQSVTFTATVMGPGGTPTGAVNFSIDGGAAIPKTLSGGMTTLSTSTLGIGNHIVTVTYGGDPNFSASVPMSLQQNVKQASTTTTLAASPNPSTPGQSVTFTATVTVTTGAGTPTGTVTFKDGGTAIGTGNVGAGGTATFTTSTLASGSHTITAVYGGDTNFAGSTSAPLIEQVGAPADSIKLRELQISATPIIANLWGQAVTGAMDDAVPAGFGGNPQSLSPAGTGFTYYFNDDPPARANTDADQDSLRRYLTSPTSSLTSPNGSTASPNGSANAAATDSVKRVDDDFRALGYAGRMPTKAPPPPSSTPHDWLAWINVRGSDYFRGTFGNDLKGDQVDAFAGLTRRISANFVVGAFGGYEHFDYSSQAFNGVLKGDGWTVGAYLGWKLSSNLRFDAGGAWSDLLANGVSGSASGNFVGTRWLVNGGLTGTYPWQSLVFEPSARVFALWEHENAYTDSLGTFQPARSFETGRASAGVKAIYPSAWTSSTVALSPYAGLYADYYFSKDGAQTAGLTTVPLLQGFSARATGGLAASFAGGATLGAGGEFGGIGSATHIWTWTARGRIPF